MYCLTVLDLLYNIIAADVTPNRPGYIHTLSEYSGSGDAPTAGARDPPVLLARAAAGAAGPGGEHPALSGRDPELTPAPGPRLDRPLLYDPNNIIAV